jgi:acyl carrier protein
VSAEADEILGLVVRRAAGVLALDERSIEGSSRFDEDLHADSLDLVEIVEGVETDLRQRGHHVAVPEEEFLAATTVEEAAAAIARHTSGGG